MTYFDKVTQPLSNKYLKRIYNTILYMVQSVEEAKDLTQEVFVEVFLSVDNFKAQSKLSTWIYRIAMNKALNHLRLKKAKKRLSTMLSIFNLSPIDDVPDFLHAGILLENKERSEALYRAIDQLPEKQKTAFVLRQLEDLSYTEIAEVMQTTSPSVESLLFLPCILAKCPSISNLNHFKIKKLILSAITHVSLILKITKLSI